jgi:hypothetical protein
MPHFEKLFRTAVGRNTIIQAVRTPLGFFTLLLLVIEGVLVVLARKASGVDFTILVITMVALLFFLTYLVVKIVRSNQGIPLGTVDIKSGKIYRHHRRGCDDDLPFLKGLIPDEIFNAMNYDSRKHHNDHIRIACAHAIWSCRPDLAKLILEEAKSDMAEVVRDHAKGLLNRNRFYSETRASRGSDDDLSYLKELVPNKLIIGSVIRDARTHHNDHIRIACAHALWSLRPDLAQSILDSAKKDLSEVVRDHAKNILIRFYNG